MVFCVRTDLGMSAGKVAAQCCHAAVELVESVERNRGPAGLGSLRSEWARWKGKWDVEGSAKIVLQVPSEEQLLELAEAATREGLNVSVIKDAGHTQVSPGSRTVLGIGPAPRSLVDRITGRLQLY